jgi:hypothetical protein
MRTPSLPRSKRRATPADEMPKNGAICANESIAGNTTILARICSGNRTEREQTIGASNLFFDITSPSKDEELLPI